MELDSLVKSQHLKAFSDWLLCRGHRQVNAERGNLALRNAVKFFCPDTA